MTKLSKENQMAVTKFFGFMVSDNAKLEDAYIVEIADVGTDLYVNGALVATIEWYSEFYDTMATEPEIWGYIMNECRKYTQAPEIFIDKAFVDRYFG